MLPRRALVLLVIALLLAPVCPGAAVAASGPMPLTAYPRPPHDSGWGIHWAPTLFGQPTDMVDRFVAEAQDMGCTWVKLLQGDAPKLEHEYLIRRLTERGIMPVLRIFQPWNDPYQHLTELVRLGVPEGVHYYELYNEPNLSGESGGWRPGEAISVDRMVELWIPAAEAVLAGGGLPGLPALAPGGDYDDVRFLRDFLATLRRQGRLDLLHRAWLPLHNYFLNHPLDYPNDPVNRHSVPLSDDEARARSLSPEEMERINHYRSISRLPREQGGFYVGDTVHEDSNGFLKFEAYARILQEEVGFVVPIITTEGGAIIGSGEDPRYPTVTEDDLVSLTVGAYDYMQHRPGYYFAFMPWLLANRAGNSLSPNWEGAAWFREDGFVLDVVPALKARISTSAPSPAQASGPSVAASPDVPVRTQGGGAAVETRLHTFVVPDVDAVSQPSSPAHPGYPLPLVPEAAQPPETPRDFEVVVLRNGAAEAWVLPELGARIVYLTSGTGSEAVPLSDRFSFERTGSGTYSLSGGVRWLYPSSALSLVDASPWAVEETGTDIQPYVVLSCAEPRSRTELRLRLTLEARGTLAATVSAANLNGQPREVSLGVSYSSPSVSVSPDGAGRVSLQPESTHEWAVTVSGTTGSDGVSVPQPTRQAAPQPTAPASRSASSASPGRPVALVTPVSAMPSSRTAPELPQAPATPAAPSVPAPSRPQASRVADWDSRLDEMDVTVERAAGSRWELVAARFEDETESGGNHHVYVELITGSEALSADAPWVAWSDGRQTLELKPAGSAWVADFPMYGPLGAYTVGVGAASDRVAGLGLPGKQHVNFRLTFRLRD